MNDLTIPVCADPPVRTGHITVYSELLQGSDEWLEARCGLLTASEMKLIITPTLKPAKNEKASAHLYELLAQRITGHVDPRYVSDDMLRGHEDEIAAREVYSERYAPVDEVGFITNDQWGFTLGFSPDGLVGDDGFIEIKSRRPKFQVETILSGRVPDDYMIQIQTGFLVSGRSWCDFISYSAGLPMIVIGVLPAPAAMIAIEKAARAFEDRMAELLDTYSARLVEQAPLLTPTERRVEQEIYC
ncbi:MAG: YqaJ viral recombinase family protein [Sphingobacterium sp.]|nr:YqaJ viral recombinase family protein [Sphingobacterium sp.]